MPEVRKDGEREGPTLPEAPETLAVEGASSSGGSRDDTAVLSDEASTTPRRRPPLDLGAVLPPPGGRYQVQEPLGRGAMGAVFRAYDTVLARHVALKVLHAETPHLVERFLQEARAQAGIAHEHVCKVFEVGLEGGRPYIAMQLVEGLTLQKAYPEMSLAQRVQVMADVCEGVHAAHRNGLIHRDLKPTNVMVERRDSGAGVWHAYVLDFGLARDPEAPGLTVTGMTVGTPAYMAPEQARGQAGALDRRTDVYGLGATLYELLTGRPPFTGSSAVEIMMRLLDQEPVPPRRRDASVPADLETIVLRCLEKDPSRRYESARALGEDLRRFLDGEPVLARPPSLTYRVAKKIRKNRLLASVVAVAGVALVAVGAVALRTQLQAAARSRAAQRFGQDVKEIEAILRYGALTPLHDVVSEKRLVRERMRRIDAEAARIGEAARAARDYALGRGHLALVSLEPAREHLERAVAADPGSAEARYALGQTLGLLYRREMELVSSIRNPQMRDRRRQELDVQLRQPALRYLVASAGVDAAPPYVEGLLAFYQKRYDEALRKADEAARLVPWLYEATRLKGEVEIAVGDARLDQGAYDEAMAAFLRAEVALRAALRIGESDAAAHEQLCWVFGRILWMEHYQRGRDIDPWLAKARPACADAVAADSESPGARTKAASYLYLEAQRRVASSLDASDVLRQAEEQARKAVELGPGDVPAYNILGNVLRTQADHEIARGLDPQPSYMAAADAFRRASLIRPNIIVLANLGLTLSAAADELRLRGKDPRPLLEEAIATLNDAVRLDPASLLARNNLGYAYTNRAQWESEHGVDPTGSLARAVESYRAANELNPSFPYGLSNLGRALVLSADFEASRGRDPEPHLDEAIRVLRRAVEVNPRLTQTSVVLGVAYMNRGDLLLSTGKDPSEWLRLAREEFDRGLSFNPDDVLLNANLIQIAAVWARTAFLRGESPSPWAREAQVALERTMRIDSTLGVAHFLASRALIWEARHRVLRGLSARDALARAAELVEKGRKLDPGFEGPLRAGEIELLRARSGVELGGSASPAELDSALDLAEESARQARRVNEGDAEVIVLEAEIAWLRAERVVRAQGDPAAAVAAGLAAVERGLGVNPRHAALHGLKGALLLLQARAAGRAEDAAAAVVAAAEAAFRRALEENPLLKAQLDPLRSPGPSR